MFRSHRSSPRTARYRRRRGARPAEVGPLEAERLRQAGALLVDVREVSEWRAGHAPGAMHVPVADLAAAAREFRHRPVLAICRSGNRSARATRALAAAGVDASNVVGGMTAWAACGLPVVDADGSPGRVV